MGIPGVIYPAKSDGHPIPVASEASWLTYDEILRLGRSTGEISISDEYDDGDGRQQSLCRE